MIVHRKYIEKQTLKKNMFFMENDSHKKLFQRLYQGVHRVDIKKGVKMKKFSIKNQFHKKTITKIVSKKYTGEILNCKTQI